ncbi:hypothetical protein ON058_10475 [Demequina sp. B12]|uniref:DUF6912 family protein n=1 Tax=Demequina sp. B12 TaxID=2992757 RepID=UPI00237B17A6|nr:hypothetical protein [Demequina sp. B12]MDE0573835.1 hypothetical protein [Demequina sp. B12]
MRVYVPATLADLDASVTGGLEVERAFAVTPRLLDISSLEDEEELAEQVRDIAAAASIETRGADLRAVLVVDFSRADVREVAGDHPAAVALSGKVVPSDVVCAFVDEVEAADAVARAARGHESAWDDLAERDLLWWDSSEFAQIPRPE